MSHCSQINPAKGVWDSFGKFDGHILGRRTLSDAYMNDCERRMPAQMGYMESLSGEYLMVDHTFWACKHVSVQVKGARPGHTRETPFNALWGAGKHEAEHGQLLVHLASGIWVSATKHLRAEPTKNGGQMPATCAGQINRRQLSVTKGDARGHLEGAAKGAGAGAGRFPVSCF
jgi:hypothetical protein